MQNKCVDNNKFVEAELCKQRIETFKKKENDLLYNELLQHQKEQVNNFNILKYLIYNIKIYIIKYQK